MAAAHILDVIPNVRVVERRNGGLYQFFLRGFYLFLGWGRHTCAFLRLCENHIFVKSVQQLFSHAARRFTYCGFKLLSLRGRHLTVQANNTVCKGSQRVFVLCPQRYIQHQFFHADSRLAFQGSCVGLLGFRHAYGIYDNKMVFILGCGRRNFLKIFFAEDARAAPFHLLKVVLAPHIAHENQTFDGLHVSSRCNHMSIFVLKAGFMAIPKSLDEAATLDGASFFRTFWTINLPLAKSALATAGILMFLGNWNEYYFASLLTVSDSQRTLPIALAFFTSEFSYNYTQLFAALTIVILPGIILYAIAQDQVQASVAASGVKG